MWKTQLIKKTISITQHTREYKVTHVNGEIFQKEVGHVCNPGVINKFIHYEWGAPTFIQTKIIDM